MRTIVVIVVLFALVLPPATTRAATYAVTRTDDPLPDGCTPADCSLREAVIAANTSVGPDTITLGADTFTLSRPDVGDEENASLTGDLDSDVGCDHQRPVAQHHDDPGRTVGRQRDRQCL